MGLINGAHILGGKNAGYGSVVDVFDLAEIIPLAFDGGAGVVGNFIG